MEHQLLLYRVSQRPHPPGFVFSAGHWRQGFDEYSMRVEGRDPIAPWRMAGEFIIEHVRASAFPDRPSRLNCCFAWPDEENARLCVNQSPGHCIEVVEPVLPDARRFVADFALLLSRNLHQIDAKFLPHVMTVARQYWTGGKAQAPEVLIESDLRLVGVLP